MSEEVKTCDCKEKCIKKLQEFVFIAGAVFVGTTLAILLSASLLRPKCPCPRAFMGPYPRMERPLPPPPPMARPDRPHWDRGYESYQYEGHYAGPNFRDPQGGPPPRMLKKHHKMLKHLKDRADRAPVPENK